MHANEIIEETSVAEPVEYAVSKAKAQLLLNHPFYSTMLFSMPVVYTKSIKTMGVDGLKLYLNPDHIAQMPQSELQFMLARQVLRNVLNHPTRVQNRDRETFKKAGSYIINEMLVDDNIGTMPEGSEFDRGLTKKYDNLTDKLYTYLMEQKQENQDQQGEGEGEGEGEGGGKGKKQNQQGNSGGSGDGNGDDELIDGGMSKEQREEVEQQTKIQAVQAAQAAKMQGKLPANMQRFIDDLISSKVPWQQILQRFVSKRVRQDRTFAKPNRRFISQGLYLPSLGGEALGEIAVAVDCSGSISEQVLNEFAAEIKNIREISNPEKIHVLYFDSRVSHVETYERGEDLNIRAHGGGGTAFSPIFRKIDELFHEIECCVVLTDLYCDDFGDPPNYPVLWVSFGSTDPTPFGEVAPMH